MGKEYIERGALWTDIMMLPHNGDIISSEDVERAIKEAPTADVVEVVRCKDCKEGEVDDPDFPDQYYCHAGCGWNKEDFFCAYGDWKDGEG